ncbi:FAD-dependent oxidoreductase [Streptomyces sp. NPDC093225]|uniref:FAD-dependent oxidoreductase n=1 Tax=Streptomyces sp. NPDC093225 TaxID=3366034 RepID=UPI00380BD2C9
MGSGIGSSYWTSSTPATEYPVLDHDRTADVVVVGGGIAGLCTAFELASAGVEVVLLEADRIVRGTTGYTTGKLTALHGLCYSRLRREHGPRAAGRYAAAQLDALARVAELCAELELDAQLERVPAYTYATRQSGTTELRAEAAAAREAGLDATYVTETGLPFPVAGAVRLDDQYQFHPRRFLLGIAHELTLRGGRIHELSRVVEVKERAHCRVEVAGGSVVSAHDVVLATGFPVTAHSALLARLGVRRELVLAAPVEAAAAPEGMYLTAEDHVRSVRTAPYEGGRRLLVVAGESFVPGADDGTAARLVRLEEWAARFAVAEPWYRWAAQDVDCVDGLPCVGHEHPGTQHVFVATGFGGWGLSNGVMAGGLLAAHVTGAARPDWTELFDPRRRLPLRDAPALVRGQAAVARHYLAGRAPARAAARVRHAGAGSAGREPDRPVVRCPHMGCELGFNAAERTWECPCHGSRFAESGALLQGPATKPLENPPPAPA